MTTRWLARSLTAAFLGILPAGAHDLVGANLNGLADLVFTDGQSGTLAYTFNGASVTKPITRQVFAATVPVCR